MNGGRLRAVAVGAVLAPLYAGAAVQAQCTYGWRPGESLPGVSGVVYAMTTWDPDGSGPEPQALVIGGAFTIAGNAIANGVAAWNGTAWQALGAGINGQVQALTVYDGELIAAGSFGSAGWPGVARWDGKAWQPLGAEVNGPVLALSVYNGELIAAGQFGGVVPHIARWNGSTWQPLGSGTNASVRALTIYDGSLIAAGLFATAGGVVVNRIARWDGSDWHPLGTGIGSNSTAQVNALAVHNGELIAGGIFSAAGGVNTRSIAAWNGSAWHALGSGIVDTGVTGDPGTVHALTTYYGELIVGGHFLVAGGVSARYIARWNGMFWQALGAGTSYDVTALAVFHNELIVGGRFVMAGDVHAQRIARWDSAVWRALDIGMNNRVRTLAAYSGELIAGGDFTHAGAANASRIARWNGSAWQALGTGMNDSVRALAVRGADLIAGGAFTTAGGMSANRVARWDGATWQPFGIGTDGAVYALTLHDGDVIAGGAFTTAGGVGASHIARWNGVSWGPLGTGMSGDVLALAVFSGELIAAGEFTSAGGMSVGRIARWNGTAWQPLGAGMSGPVRSLTTYDENLVAGGSFITAGGIFSNHVARWDGVAWQPLGSGIYNCSVCTVGVYALVVYQSELVAAGSFVTAGGLSANSIARWNGAAWQPAGSGLGYISHALTLFNGELIVGGAFLSAGDYASAYWARWGPTGPAPQITQQPAAATVAPGDAAAFSVSTSGAGALAYRWRRNDVDLTDGGSVSGANASMLTINPVGYVDAGRYDCLVTLDGCGVAVSNDAVLSVPVGIISANPPQSNPYVVTEQPFRDVLQNTTTSLAPRGIGVSGTPAEGPYTYAPINVTFSGPPSPPPGVGNITVACTDIAGNGPADCPTVTSVYGAGAGPYLITLSGPPPARECLTLTFSGTTPGQKLQYQSLPGDVSMNGVVTGSDVLALVVGLNDGIANITVNLARYDINRNGSVTGSDVVRLIQLLNGGSTVSPPAGFNAAAVATCP